MGWRNGGNVKNLNISIQEGTPDVDTTTTADKNGKPIVEIPEYETSLERDNRIQKVAEDRKRLYTAIEYSNELKTHIETYDTLTNNNAMPHSISLDDYLSLDGFEKSEYIANFSSPFNKTKIKDDDDLFIKKQKILVNSPKIKETTNTNIGHKYTLAGILQNKLKKEV